jgi:ribulose-5-phosphate 4-epimerase/fuculose-1-phosphate aldolase
MELSQRQQLAAAFHIATYFGWDQLIYNHFTARVSYNASSFLVHPFGLLFSEVAASSLLEVDLESGELIAGQTVHPDASSEMPYNATSYVLHSCVYKARPDVACVLHVHVPCIVAVASSATGLVQGISQESCLIGPVSYHDYEGISTSMDEQARIVLQLGKTNNVLMLRNHGVLCCGRSVAHAMSVLYHVWRACLIQIDLGEHKFVLPPPNVIEKAFQTHENFTKTGNCNLEFEALIRKLKRSKNTKFLE